MVGEAGSSSTALSDKPVIVRVKRKSYQSPLEAFWLEISERPVKRPLLDFENLSINNSASQENRPLVDFEKLSINNSASQVEELKPKKFFVQHVETVSSSDVTVDVLQSLSSKSTSADALDSKAKVEDQRRSNKTDNKHKQLLVKAKESQEILAKNARFEQIWKSRKGKGTGGSDDVLRDMCHLYDVVRVDTGETSGVHEQDNEEDERLMRNFLPLLREFIPSAAEGIESDFDHQMIKKASKDEYVYDLYAVKDGNIVMMEEDTSSPYPFVQLQVNEDDFYDGPDNSDYETDDSNAEDNPMNDYPEEQEEEEESESGKSDEKSEEDETESVKSSIEIEDLSEGEKLVNFDDDEDYDDDDDDDDDDEDCYW